MKYLIPLLAMFLWSCSPNNQQKQNPVINTDFATTSALVEFGSVKLTDSQKLVSATIYNDTGTNLSGPATLSSSDFYFLSGYNCPVGAKNKTSCSAIKLIFNPAGKNPGEYNATLDLGSISVPVHATIESPPAPVVSISSSLGSDINFGSFLSTTNSSVTKTITITNTGAASIPGSVSLSGTAYLKNYDTCNGSTIAKSATCQIKISFNPYNKTAGNLNEILTVNGMAINLSATVATPESIAQGGQPVVIGGVTYSSDVKFYNGTSVVTDYSYPLNVAILTVTIKNSGNLAALASSVVLSNSTIFSFATNTCSNIALAANQSCQIKVSFNASLVGSYSTNLTFGGKILAISAIKGGCNPGFHIEGNSCVADVISFTPNYYNFGSCSAVACDGTGNQSRSLVSCQKNVNNLPVTGGTLADCAVYDTVGYLQQTCPSPAGNKTVAIQNGEQIKQCPAGSSVQTLVSTSCAAGFNNQNNVCVADTITYTASYSVYGSCSAVNACDGQGLTNRTISSCQKLRNGVPEAGGQISDCSSFSVPANLQTTCDSPAGNKTIGISNGEQVVQCSAGSLTAQSIVSTNCNLNFHNENNVCVADVISYTANYSAYGACSTANACDGQGLKLRTIDSCQKLRNGIPEAGGQISDCAVFNISANLQQACDSPAGNKTVAIQNGDQTVSCPVGSTVQTIVSTTCAAGFNNQNNICVADVITYTANYSTYGSCSAANACDGQGLKNKTISSCQKFRNGMPEAGGLVSDCSAFNISANLQQTCDSPAGNKSINITNGTQVIQCSAGSLVAQSIVSTSCAAGFNNQNNVCVADVITYTASYSTYGSCSAINACDGQGLKNRTITACQKIRNGIPEAGGQVSDCSSFSVPANLQTTCDSPAGNKTVAIQNGEQIKQCAAGSNIETLVSTSCNPGFNNQNNVCVADVITYTANYSTYGSCSASNACDGKGLKNRTISSCQKLRNGIPETGGQISDCSAFNISANLQQTCDSPAGNKTIAIQNGDQTVSCPVGSSVQTIVSTTCAAGFNNQNNICVADVITYTANYSTYGSCSASNACDGKGLKNRTISSCQKLRNGIPESGGQISDCAAFNISSNLQLTCDSPAGNKIVRILNGDQTVSCPTGSTVQTIVSTACDTNYYQSANSCLLNSIVLGTNSSLVKNTSYSLNISSCGAANKVLVKLDNSAPNVSQGLVNCATTIPVTLSSTQGLQTIYVWGYDGVSFTASSVNQVVTLDSVAPVVSLTSPLQGSSQKSTATLIGTCETGLPVNISGSGLSTTVNSNCVASAFSQLVTFSAGEGSKTISLSQTDAAGNISNIISRNIIKDSIAPILTQTAYASPVTINGNTLTLSGVCENSISITVTGTDTSSTTCNAGLWTYTTVSQATDASRRYNFTQTDLAGNETLVVVDWIRDNTPPIGFAATLNSSSLTNVASGAFLVNCGPEATAYQISTAQPGGNSGSWVNCSQNTFNVPVSLSSGSNNVQFWFKDAVNNVSTTSAGGTIVVDTDIPTDNSISILTANPTNSINASFSVLCDATANGYKISTTKPLAADSGWISCSQTNFSYTLTEGVNDIRFWFKDEAGNVTLDYIVSQVTLNTSGPQGMAVQLISTTPTNNATAQFSLTCGTAARYKIQDTAPLGTDSGWTSCTAGVISKTLSLQGTNNYKFWFKDIVDNVTASAIQIPVVYDTNPPVTATTALTSTTPTANPVATFNLTCGDASTYQWSATKPLSSSSSWISCQSGSINYNLTNGTNSLNIWYKDLAGNVSTVAQNFSIVLNTGGPANYNALLTSAAVTNQTTASFNLTCGTATHYKIISARPAAGDAGWNSCVSGNITPSLIDGANILNFWFKDNVNVVTASSLDFTVVRDNTAPILTQVLVDSNAAKTISGLVSVQTNATDAYEMYVTQNSSCSAGGSWETYANPRNNLVLTSANSVNTVYVKVRDQAGNESSCLNDAIYFGVDSPLITLLSGSPTNSHTAQIRIDNCLSAPQVLLNEDPFALATDSGWSTCVNNTVINYNLSADDGLKTVASWGKAGTVVSLIGNQVSVSIDTISPPAPEVLLASPAPYGDGYISSQNVALSVTNCPAGVDKILVTENSAIPANDSSGWQNCSLSNINFSLSSSGSKKMYVWGMDIAKNISDLPGIVDVKVAGTAVVISKVSGDNQAVARTSLSDELVAKVVDANGFPVQGAVVSYSSSKGILTSSSKTSGVDGVISNTITVGNTLESFVINLTLGSVTQGFNMSVADLAFNNTTISTSNMLEYMERTQNLNLNSEGVAPVVENGWQNRWVTTETSIMNPNNSLTIAASVTPATVTPIYSVLQPSFLNSLSFSGGNASFTRSQISSSGSLQVKATSSLDPNNFKLSNILNVKKSRQQIVTNIGYQQIITPSILGRVGNYVIFSSLNELGIRKLYSYDIVLKTTLQLPDSRVTGDVVPTSGRGVTLSNGWLYYAGYNAQTASTYMKMYRTNGATISQVTNIKGDTLTDGINQQSIISLNNRILFYAYAPGTTFTKLYAIDSTNTLSQISNTYPTGSDQYTTFTPENAVINNGYFYLSFYNSSNVPKIFRTDGVTTVQVSNVNGTSVSDNFNTTVETTVIDNGILYILGGTNAKLFKIDLSTLTVTQISNFNGSGVNDMYQTTLRGINGYLYMTTQDGSALPHLSSYNIQTNTFTQLSSGGQYQPVSYFSLSNYPGYPGQYCNNKLYVQMYSYLGTPSNNKLYEVDGTTLTQVSNTRNDQALSDSITYITCFNNELFFGANNPYIVARNKLYKYADGEISQVANISNNNNSSDFITNLFIHSNNLYFIARGTATNREPQLHRYNTSSKALQRLNISEPAYSIVALTATNNYKDSENLVLTINSSRKLINYSIGSNSSASIIDVKNTRTTDTPSLNAAKQPLVFNNEMYFAATNSGGAEKLFKTNGSTITQVSNTSLSYVTSDSIQNLMSCNNSLFFTATNGDGYSKLYKSNGTLNSTQQISNYFATGSDTIVNLVCLNNRLYFNASIDNFATSSIFIKTDGETFTTLTQLDPIFRSGYYNASVVFNNKIYFLATTATSGGTVKLYEIDSTANTVKLNTSANSQGITFYGNTTSSISTICTTQGACNPFMIFNGNLMMQGRNSSLNQKMYYMNTLGTVALAYDSRGIATSDLYNVGSSVLRIWGTVTNNSMYYVGYNSSGVLKLMKLTSVPGTPTAVGNINAATTNDFNTTSNFIVNRIVAVGNYLYFSGLNSPSQIKLYRMDMTTNVSTLISSTYSLGSDTPQYLTNYNGSLYFLSLRLNNETGSGTINKTFKYDPSTNTVSQVTNNGRTYNVTTQLFTLNSDLFQYPAIFQSELYFYGNNEYNVGKIYRICEVGAGCSP